MQDTSGRCKVRNTYSWPEQKSKKKTSEMRFEKRNARLKTGDCVREARLARRSSSDFAKAARYKKGKRLFFVRECDTRDTHARVEGLEGARRDHETSCMALRRKEDIEGAGKEWGPALG